MAVGSLHLFEHESTKGSCMYLGFSENSITLAADTLLRNTNKTAELIKGPDSSFSEMRAGKSPGSTAPGVEECPLPCIFLHLGQLRTRLI